AIAREVAEECGCVIHPVDIAGVVERIVRDDAGRIRYHYVLVDYLAYADTDAVVAGSDADEARWVPLAEVERLETTDGLLDMIRRALALAERKEG
ncbi:MAG TPA: NUDIX domain-containing protein, partial [Methylomirabilota bacterium]|nr:NUDIX domain-containing protein [Methylomirabilota bacterium]